MNLKNSINKNIYSIISGVVFLAMFSLVLYRAVYLGITYDEVWTFDIASNSILDIMTAEKNFQSANNHILNSILIKPCLQLFGHHVWVLRLPNVVAYVLYFFASAYIASHVSNRTIVKLMAIILFNTNIYLLDFFSLARGYGLANAFEMGSIAFVFAYLQYEKNYFNWLIFLFASLAVFSNFTWLNFYAPLWAVFMYIHATKNKFNLKSIFYKSIPALFFAIITLLFSYIPISFLKQQNEFKWGANAWIDSLHTFAKDFNYSNSFGAAVILQIILIVLFLFSVWAVYKKKANTHSFLLFTTLLIFTIICATIVQRFLLHTMYMDGRKATMYIPLLVCIIACLVDSYYTKFQSLSYLLIVLFTVHFIYCIRPLSTREWWFDAHNQEVMSFIDTHPVDGQKSITTSWHFGSAMNYYNRFTFNNRITTMSNFREASVNLSPTYFYVLDEDISKIPSGYKLVKKYSIGSYLYTR